MHNLKRPRDVNQLSKHIVDLSVGDIQDDSQKEESPAAILGRKGGKARAIKLTQKQRQEIAYTAIQARWKKNNA